MEAAQRNQIKKARQLYLDILRLEQKQAAGQQLNAEQQAKLGRKQEVADKLAALGIELPELAGAEAAGGQGVASSGGGGGSTSSVGVLRVRPGHAGSAPGPFSSFIPKSDILGAMAGVKPLSADSYQVLSAEQQAKQAPAHQFVVKVQVPLAPGSSAADLPMLLYNQARTFQCYLKESSGADAARLAQLVRMRGIRGQKGYFEAWMEGEELVLREQLLPLQPW